MRTGTITTGRFGASTSTENRTYKRDKDGRFASTGSGGDLPDDLPPDRYGNSREAGKWFDPDGGYMTDSYVDRHGLPVTHSAFGHERSHSYAVTLSQDGGMHVVRHRSGGPDDAAYSMDTKDVTLTGLSAASARSLAKDVEWVGDATTRGRTHDPDTGEDTSGEDFGVGTSRTNAATGVKVTAGRDGDVVVSGMGVGGKDLTVNSGELTESLNAMADVADQVAAGTYNRAPVIVGRTAGRGLLVRNEVDLSALQAEFERQLNALLRRWTDISAAQRAQIVDQVRVAVTSNDLAALARLHVSTSEAAQVLTEAMADMALEAARQVTAEAEDQGIRLDPVASDTAPFAATAVAITALLAEALTNSGGREALRRWSPTTSGDEVSAAVDEHLASLSDSFVRDNLGGAMHAAVNAGRMNTMLTGPSAAIYGSEQMDRNTCLAPDTLVTTRRGAIPAEQVRLDDRLLTHAGRWMQPSHLLITEVDEDLIALRLDGQRELLVTWDHPVLVLDRGELVWRHAGQITEGALVLDQSSLQSGTEIIVPDLFLGQAPDDVAAFDQFGGLAPVNVRAQRMPVATVSLDDEVADEEINDPSADLRLRREVEPGRFKFQPDGPFDRRLQSAGHVAPLGAVTPDLSTGWYDSETGAAVFADNEDGWTPTGLAAVGAVGGQALSEHRAAAAAGLVPSSRFERTTQRAVVVPLVVADRDAEIPATLGASLGHLPAARGAQLGQHLRVGELAGDRAVDGSRSTAAQDSVLAQFAEPGNSANSPALNGGVLLAPRPASSNGDTAVRTRLVHGLSVVRVDAVDRMPHQGFVYDFTVPGDETFWADGVLVHNCKPCRKINGKWIGNSDDPDIAAKVEAVYPNGGYKNCLGGVRCRGTLVAIWRPEQTEGPGVSVTVQ